MSFSVIDIFQNKAGYSLNSIVLNIFGLFECLKSELTHHFLAFPVYPSTRGLPRGPKRNSSKRDRLYKLASGPILGMDSSSD